MPEVAAQLAPRRCGDKPYPWARAPRGADASDMCRLSRRGWLPERFKTPIRSAAELQPNLVAYRDRMIGTADFAARLASGDSLPTA